MKAKIIVEFEYDIGDPSAYVDANDPSGDDYLSDQVIRIDGRLETVEILLANSEYTKGTIECYGKSHVFL